MKLAALYVLLAGIGLNVASGFAINVGEYLIEGDIGKYSVSYPGSCPKGSGILGGAGHFRIDHTDYACDIRYYDESIDLGAEVQVTQHVGSDSDRWLLHEMDRDFRNYHGLPGRSYGPRVVDGQTILESSVGGANYRWLSGTKIIMIEYRDPQLTKPEPVEVINAYLAKHPSTLLPMTLAELRSKENVTRWIKDEMERRLWLCDKWFLHYQMAKVELSESLQAIVKSMNVFLDYRERYYGIKAQDEKVALMGYLDSNNGTAIRSKLSDYRNWWTANKNKGISLP